MYKNNSTLVITITTIAILLGLLSTQAIAEIQKQPTATPTPPSGIRPPTPSAQPIPSLANVK